MKYRAWLVAFALTLSAPVAAFAGNPASPAAQVQPAERAPAKTDQKQEEKTYAQREEQSKDLEKFEGGQTVVIVTSLTTVLIVLLILVLLL